MEKNYRLNSVEVYKEDIAGQIPVSPKTLEIKGLTTLDIKESQKTETNPTLDAGGQGSKKDRGTSEFSGNMELKYTPDLMPFIVTHAVGNPTTVVSAATGAWADSTAFVKFDKFTRVGDIVTLSTTSDYYLVCKTAGTTDSTEPTPTKVGEIIVDGTVVWEARKPIFKYEGVSEPCLVSFGLEGKSTSGCSTTPTDFIKRIGGLFLDGFEMKKASGDVIFKSSVAAKGMNADDNVINSVFESVSAKAGYEKTVTIDRAYGYEDLKVQLGGSEPVDARDFSLSLSRNVGIEDGVALGVKVQDNPALTLEGSINLKFTKEQYEKYYNENSEEVKVLYGSDSGVVAHFTMASVGGDRVDPDMATDKVHYLSVPLTASGDKNTPTMSYVIYSEVNYF